MEKIVLTPNQPFDLDLTLSCGQAFRWEKIGEWWYGIVADNPFKMRQNGNTLEFENVSPDFVEKYFGLTDDLPSILKQIAKDKHIAEAIKAVRGLRILRQDPWECLISYICATYKNIPAIKQMLFKLSKKFGEKTVFDNRVFYTFPTPQKLAKASLTGLVGCGLGYRAKYVAETAKRFASGEFNFEGLKASPFEKAREALLALPGVGLKVADCVLLFSLERFEAFPVDVWVRRIIIKYYANHFEDKFMEKVSSKKSLTKAEYERLSLFGRSYFGRYAGYAQEYLFHFERTMDEKHSLN
ncbi:MAG: 8-oxoguanine DNA glycosylase [Candidatus Bathyarchaeota archaeon]|nr:8-oxoguanine DNA glycosylase [Candidatus Bathyarchaeota archaeon]